MAKSRAILLAIVFILTAAPMAASPVFAKVKPGCPGAKALVVDATLTVRNVDDRAVDGHVWALDAYSERIRLWHVDADRYCAQLDDIGTFTSFAGVSPAGTGTISASVTGSFVATQYISVTGDFAPKTRRPVSSGTSIPGATRTACARTTMTVSPFITSTG